MVIKQKKKKAKKPKKIEKEDNIDIIASSLEWAKKNNIYISNKIVLNKKIKRENHFYFSADSRILGNTLLLRIPYDIMITQFSLNEIYKDSKFKKFQNLWDKIINLNSSNVKFFQTKQLLYMSIIIENAIRKKKGPIYKKYKEYFRMYDNINMDIFPIFYEENEKYYLSESHFGSQLMKASESLKEEYYLLSNKLDIDIPDQDEFLKARVLSTVTSTDFNNSNFNYSNKYNETVIVPFLDCFKKVISSQKSNARIEIKEVKNSTNNFSNYFLEIYSNGEIFLGGEINLEWRPFTNPEFLLYYGLIEEENPYRPKYNINFMNGKLRKDLNMSEDTKFYNIYRDTYDLNREFYSPSVINTYRNLSLHFDKYNNTEEGPYEMMLDNLKYYSNLYEDRFTDGNINIYINGDEKVKDIKEIMHQEKKIFEGKVQYLENVVKGIKLRNSNSHNNNNKVNKKETKENNQEDL